MLDWSPVWLKPQLLPRSMLCPFDVIKEMSPPQAGTPLGLPMMVLTIFVCTKLLSLTQPRPCASSLVPQATNSLPSFVDVLLQIVELVILAARWLYKPPASRPLLSVTVVLSRLRAP